VMDKLATAAIAPLARLDRFGVETIPTVGVGPETTEIDLDRPWVVKPRFGGSSLGVEVGVEDAETVAALSRTGERRSGAVVQPYLDGWTDLNVAVRSHPAIEVSAVERPLAAGVYSYQEKYLSGADGMESARRELPADLPEGVLERVHGAARAIVETVGLTGLPRIDFLHDGGDRLALCEVNSIPGSLGLYLWAASGHDRTKILLDAVAEARRVPPVPPHWSAATDGAALRSAAGIASKLR
jgi:D-alanine-D-alanine ligase